MNSKIKTILSKISLSHQLFNKDQFSEIKELIEEYIYYEQSSKTKIIIIPAFYKELSSIIESVRYIELLDLLYSFFCALIDFTLIKESNYAHIIFNFSKAYMNLDLNTRSTRILINYFLPEQGMSSYAYIERYLYLKKQIGTNYDLQSEINKVNQCFVKKMNNNQTLQYHFNLIIMLLQSILNYHALMFNTIKELLCNYSSFSEIQCDNLFKLLYRLNDIIVGEINNLLNSKNLSASTGKLSLKLEIFNKFRLSNEIKSFIYMFLPDRSKNFNNLFNFISIHLAEIILLLKKLIELNYEICKDFTRTMYLFNLNHTIINVIDSNSSKGDVQWIMRTYGKLYNISKIIGDTDLEQSYILKIKSIYQKNCFVGNETYLIYVSELKDLVRSVTISEGKLETNGKVERNVRYEEIKLYLDDIIFIVNNISLVEEEDCLNFEIIVEKLNNTIDCLYLYFSTNDYYLCPLITNVKIILNKIESLYLKIQHIYETKILSKNKRKRPLYSKVSENSQFYQWINILICCENSSKNINEKEVINLFLNLSGKCRFQNNDSIINNLRIRSILILCFIQFENQEYLRNFLNVFSINSDDFPIFLSIIDEFFNILHVDNLIKNLSPSIFIQILRIIIKSISSNHTFISKIKQLKEKIENKLLRFVYNFFCNIDIKSKDLCNIINNMINSLNDTNNVISLDNFKNIIQNIIFNTICLKILQNLNENDLMIGDCEQILLNLIKGVDISEINYRFQIFSLKLLKNCSLIEQIKQSTVPSSLIETYRIYIDMDSNSTIFSHALDKKFKDKYKVIDESLDKGLIAFYKFQKILKNHFVSKSNTINLNPDNFYNNIEDSNLSLNEMFELIEIYNLTYCLGDETTPKRVCNTLWKKCTNERIKSFFILNFNNEMMLNSFGKYKLCVEEKTRIGLEFELNKLIGISISDDINDYNNIRDIMILIEIYTFCSLQPDKELKRKFPHTKKLKDIFNKILSKKKQQLSLSKIEVILFLKILYSKLLKHYINGDFSYFLSNSYYFLQSSLPSLKAIVTAQKFMVNLINNYTQNINLIKDIIDNKSKDSDEFQKKINHLIFSDDLFLVSMILRMIKKIILFFLRISKKFGQYDKFLEVIRTIYDYNLLHIDIFFMLRLNFIISFSFKGIFNENVITIFNKNVKDKNFLMFLMRKYFKLMNIILKRNEINEGKDFIISRLVYVDFVQKLNHPDLIDNSIVEGIFSGLRTFFELCLNPISIKNGFYLINEVIQLFLFYFQIFKFFLNTMIEKRSLIIELTNSFHNVCSYFIKNISQEQTIFLDDLFYIQLEILMMANKSKFESVFKQSIIPKILNNQTIDQLLAKREGKKLMKFYLLYEDNYVSFLKKPLIISLLQSSSEYKEKAYTKSILEVLINLSLSNNIITQETKELIIYLENYVNIKNEVIKYTKYSQKFPSVFNLNCMRKSLDQTNNDLSKRYSDIKEKQLNCLSFYRVKDFFIFSLKADGETAINIIPSYEIICLKKEFSLKIEKEIIEFQDIKVKEDWFRKLSIVEKNIENFLFSLQRSLINSDIRKILVNIYSKSAKFIEIITEQDILYEVNSTTINDFLFCFLNTDKSEKMERVYQEKLFKKDLQISLKKFYKDFFIVNKIDGFINEQPFKLFISSELNNLPIENIPILYNLMILRVYDKTAIKPKNFKLNIKETKQVCYLVNPGEEILKINNVQKIFIKQKFHNLYEKIGSKNEAELKEEISNRIKDNCKVYFYCGHSTGKKYFKPNFWKETRISFPAFLLGCSSVNIKNKFYDSSSLVDFVSFLLLNDCPFICGNLWDITDKDMDIYAYQIVEKVFSKRNTKSFYDAHFLARKEMKSKFLNRAAMVIYGNDVIINT